MSEQPEPGAGFEPDPEQSDPKQSDPEQSDAGQEPQPREHVLDAIDWIGWDRLLFATDYPHWDYDDPDMVLPMPLSEQKRRDFFLNNAAKLYKQG